MSISLTLNLRLTEEGRARGQADTTLGLAAAAPAGDKLFPACLTQRCAADTQVVLLVYSYTAGGKARL